MQKLLDAFSNTLEVLTIYNNHRLPVFSEIFEEEITFSRLTNLRCLTLDIAGDPGQLLLLLSTLASPKKLERLSFRSRTCPELKSLAAMAIPNNFVRKFERDGVILPVWHGLDSLLSGQNFKALSRLLLWVPFAVFTTSGEVIAKAFRSHLPKVSERGILRVADCFTPENSEGSRKFPFLDLT
jgi:hypothetical protein